MPPEKIVEKIDLKDYKILRLTLIQLLTGVAVAALLVVALYEFL